MKRKPKPRHAFNPFFWFQVKRSLWCNLGDHSVPAGHYVRQRRGDYRRVTCCEVCLDARGVPCPERRPFTFKGDDAIDVRARQAGDE
jgi:hypothetical protein